MRFTELFLVNFVSIGSYSTLKIHLQMNQNHFLKIVKVYKMPLKNDQRFYQDMYFHNFMNMCICTSG